VGFDQSFSFLYSRRPGTPAASLPDEIEPAVKQQRLARLQEQLESQARAISERMVGTRQRVLIERPAKRNARELAGRTANNRWVNLAGPATLIGRFVDVLVTAAHPHSLRGRLADAPGSAHAAPPAASGRRGRRLSPSGRLTARTAAGIRTRSIGQCAACESVRAAG